MPQTSENIDTYAIRLKNLVDIVKYRTGKPKVNIIAHSMGGLVARRYVQLFGEDSVSKLVLVATPNSGIEGSIEGFCTTLGERRECEDMSANSPFMSRLNDPTGQPKQVKAYTITGTGCNTRGLDGDGIVAAASSRLSFARNYDINGTCTLFQQLHGEMLDISKFPETYEIVKEILQGP